MYVTISKHYCPTPEMVNLTNKHIPVVLQLYLNLITCIVEAIL